MITYIKVDGFKTLSGFELTLNPGLNILVGPNGSGKTNIVSFFEYLAHLVETDPAEATSLLGGAGAVFRRVKDTTLANIEATVFGSFSLENQSLFPFAASSRKNESKKFAFYEYGFTLLFALGLESVVFAKQHFRYKHSSSFIPAEKIRAESNRWSLEIDTALDSKEMVTKAKVRRHEKDSEDILPFFGNSSKGPEEQLRETEGFLSQIFSTNTSIPSVLCRFNPRMFLLSQDISGGQTYNVIPSRVKMPEDSARPPGIATDGSGLSSTLYSLKRRNRTAEFKPWTILTPGRANAMKTPTLETLKGYFQLANNSIHDVDVSNDSFSNQLRVSFEIRSGEYAASVPLSLMSDGTLKWITLLTAALTASSVFSIEEPENYLHPQMQGQFIKIIREILFKERKNVCTLTWRDDWHRTDVSFDPAPTSLVAGGPGEVSVATFGLVVAPGQTGSVEITVRASRLRESNLDADAGAARIDWSGVSIDALDPRLAQTLTAGLDDLQHLLLTDPQEQTSVFAAAGTPWYLTLFGRDSLWAARMTLPFGTELAAGTLRALARRQGAVVDADSAEAPGKIPHELRRTTFSDAAQGMELPPVYYGTVDATPLWISLLRDAWKWGLADRDVEALLPNLQAAARWLTELAAPDEDGLLKYIDTSGKGLANQGWKDSGDSVRWRDGRIADAPIALCEAAVRRPVIFNPSP